MISDKDRSQSMNHQSRVRKCENEYGPGRSPAGSARDAAHIFSIVEAAGHRLTEPRRELIRAVSAQAERPFTGEDLYDELRETGLGRATVFRTLKLLLDLNVLSRLHMEDGCQQYILAPADDTHGDNHHDRLICRECGRVSYLDHCPMEDILPDIAQRFGYNVEGHHLDIIGLCGECHGRS